MTDDFGNVILDDGVNEKLLNEYFVSIFTKENLVDIPLYNKHLMKMLQILLISLKRKCMLKKIKLRGDKSPDADGIYPVTLKILQILFSNQ